MSEESINHLKERVKELSCLYQISRIASKQNSLDDTLNEIVHTLPKAWRFADLAIAQIKLSTKLYTSVGKLDKCIHQRAVIKINENIVGHVAVHYPIAQVASNPFLNEEQELLNNVAIELATIIEREERKAKQIEIENYLKRNDRLTILGEITAGIAHELNTPLANILGFAQFIQKKATNPQIEKDSQKIIRSAIHAREIVKKLMFFSCDMPQYMEIDNLNQTVIEAIKLLNPTLSEKGVELKIIEKDENIQAQFDQVQITQVVFNLVINAINACSNQGKILITISIQGQNARILIEDNGIGIHEELLDKIFEPFYSTKNEKSGTGLGLSVVHGIIKSHKGNLQVQSTLNVGTKFIVDLPLTQEP